MRLAARYEEDFLSQQTTIGYPNSLYSERLGDRPRLGGGLCFLDEAAGHRELSANASRIEAWRRTESYKLCQAVRIVFPIGTGPLILRFRISRRWSLQVPFKDSMWPTSFGDSGIVNGCQMGKLS